MHTINVDKPLIVIIFIAIFSTSNEIIEARNCFSIVALNYSFLIYKTSVSVKALIVVYLGISKIISS
jgi:hypothetical protein